jgi:CHAD domain-containing protein
VARAREVPGFDCDEPFAAAAARVVRVRAAEVFEHSEGVLDIGEIDHLHDMQVKALADALGERRDRDVAIEFLAEFAEAAPEAERPALTARIEALREEQRQANDYLVPYLEGKRLRKLQRRLEKLVEAVGR